MIIYIAFLVVIFLFLLIDQSIVLPNIKILKSKNLVINNSIIFNKHNNRDNNIKELSLIYKLAIIIIFSFSAFRFYVGWDYGAYYETIKYHTITNIISNGEYLNILLIELSRKINIINLYFFVNTFICMFYIVKTIKNYSKDVWLSLIFFVCFPLFFLNSLSVIRIFSALAISFYGFKYIQNKNFSRYVITVIIASMFHKSAVIAIIFYFLKDIKLKTYKMVLILISLPFISVLLNSFVVKYIPRYLAYTMSTTGQEGTKAIIVFVIIGICGLLLRDRIVDKNPVANTYYNLFYVGLCIYLMFFKQGTMGHRLSLYGTIYSLLLIPHMVCVFKNKRDQLILKIIIYALCIAMFIFTVYIGAGTYIPYKTIWQSN